MSELSANEVYCRTCGSVIHKEAEICPKCGVRQTRAGGESGGNEWLVTLLLCIFMGYFGVHRFYTGSIGIGVVQLCTLGGCGIWWMLDLILIVTGAYKDGDGKPLVKKL